MSMTAPTPRKWTLREKIFGARVTQSEMLKIETEAIQGGYYHLIQAVILSNESKRARRNFLAYVRDGLITFEVYEISEAYTDDDPFEGMGNW